MSKLPDIDLTKEQASEILEKHKADFVHHVNCFQMIAGGFIPFGEEPEKHRPRQVWQCHKDCKVKYNSLTL